MPSTERIGDVAITPVALAAMRERGGQWAVYECHALDSPLLGALQFLRYGDAQTFKTPPRRWPGAGVIEWAFVHVGYVDLAKGDVVATEVPHA